MKQNLHHILRVVGLAIFLVPTMSNNIATAQYVDNYNHSEAAPTGQMLYYNVDTDGGFATLVAPKRYDNNPGIGPSWYSYDEPEGTLSIPDSVTYGGAKYAVKGIDEWALGYCSEVTSIEIPATVATIGVGAFGSTGIMAMPALPPAMHTIPEGLFRDCSSLLTAEIPSTIDTIGIMAFASTGLQRVTISGAVYIGSSAFGDCYALDSISLPGTLRFVGGGAFGNLSYFNFNGTMDQWCRIKWEGVSPISQTRCLYMNDTLLRHAVVPEGIDSIYAGSFSDNDTLLSVLLPSTLTYIESYAFMTTSDSLVYYMNSANPPEGMIEMRGKTLVHVPCGSAAAYRQAYEPNATITTHIIDPCEQLYTLKLMNNGGMAGHSAMNGIIGFFDGEITSSNILPGAEVTVSFITEKLGTQYANAPANRSRIYHVYVDGVEISLDDIPQEHVEDIDEMGRETNFTRYDLTITMDADHTVQAVFGPYDTTGVGIVEVENDVMVYSEGTTLHVVGAAGEPVSVYAIDGRMVFSTMAATATQRIDLPMEGIYMLVAGRRAAQKVVAIR